MKRPFAFFAFFAVALAGCFSPDDIFVLDGTVVTAAPEGQVVRLYRGKPDDDRVCRQLSLFKETTADAEGRYTFEVFRAQAQSLNGVTKDPCFQVQAEFPSFSVAAVLLSQVFGPEELPALPDWRPDPQLVDGEVRFTPVTVLPTDESVEGPWITHRLEVTDASSRLAWRQDDLLLDPAGPAGPTLTRVPLRFDPFTLVEEQGVVGRFEARLTEGGGGRGGGPFEGRSGFGRTVEVIAGQTLAVTSLQPHPTRDAPCRAFGAPCRLTDGDYTPTAPDLETGIMEVDLPGSLVPGRLVARGLETTANGFSVELLDASGVAASRAEHALPTSAWDPSGAALELPLAEGTVLRRGGPPKHFFVVPLGGTAPQFRVRVRFSSPVQRLGELSVVE